MDLGTRQRRERHQQHSGAARQLGHLVLVPGQVSGGKQGDYDVGLLQEPRRFPASVSPTSISGVAVTWIARDSPVRRSRRSSRMNSAALPARDRSADAAAAQT